MEVSSSAAAQLTTFVPTSVPISLIAWVVQMVVFHGVGLAFEWLERSGRLARYRVRRPDFFSYRELLPKVLVNQCLVLLPAMYLCEATGLAFTGPAYSVWHFLAALAGMAIGHDVIMYMTHRFLLHHPRCRRLGHHVHHSTSASRSISACYMSLPDYFLQIACPYLIPLVVLGGGGGQLLFHVVTVAGGAIGGLYEHSGYDFGVILRQARNARMSALWRWVGQNVVSSHAHGQHHLRSNVSFSDGFGSPSLCDMLCGTRWDLVNTSTRSLRAHPSSEPVVPHRHLKKVLATEAHAEPYESNDGSNP